MSISDSSYYSSGYRSPVYTEETTVNSKKLKEYAVVRNYAEYRCHKVEHSLKASISDKFYRTGAFDEILHDIEDWVSGRYTFNGKHFFFEVEQDAMLFRLKHG